MVTIVRVHHAFEGRSLKVFGAMHRKGRLLLVLILRDGSKSMIPADWTDLASSTEPVCAGGHKRSQAATRHQRGKDFGLEY
jgi:hypothetical protein